MTHMLSRPQGQARRPAHRAPCIKVREPHALLGELIKVRGRNRLLSEAPEIPVSEIIAHDPNDVGFVRKIIAT